ncbi:MAG: lysylphosphatidylglycerol synthase transmembrane domain-containing protein [Atribacterota bacterium]
MHRQQRYESKKIFRQIVFSVAISMGTMAAIFAYFAFRQPMGPFFSFRILPLLVGFLFLTAAWVFDATRIYFTTRWWGRPILYRNALSSVLSAYFMSAITPFMVGGGPAQMYVLIRSGLSWGEAGSLVAVCGILYQVSLLLLIFIFIFVFHIGLALQGILLKLLYSFAVFYSVIMFLLFFFLYRPRVLYQLTDWGIAFVKKHFRKARFSEIAVREGVEDFFGDFRRGFGILFRKKPQYLGLNILCYCLRYLCIFLVAYWVLVSVGVSISAVKVVATQIPLNYIYTVMPTPGSSGGAEASMASVFFPFTGPERIGLFVLLWRVITYYFPLIAGGYDFFRRVLRMKVAVPTPNREPSRET